MRGIPTCAGLPQSRRMAADYHDDARVLCNRGLPDREPSREELVGAVGFIAVAPSPIEAMEELERGKAKPSDYWAEQSSQEGQGRLFSAVNFRF